MTRLADLTPRRVSFEGRESPATRTSQRHAPNADRGDVSTTIHPPKRARRHGVLVKLAISGGAYEEVDAKQIDIGRIRGVLCVHPRRPEAQHAATVMQNWVVTHIPSGRAVAYGYTMQGAIDEARRAILRIGHMEFRRLTLVHTVTAKRKARRPRKAQGDLFAETVVIER